MKADSHAGFSGAHYELIAASEAASRAIPPLWPLGTSVAVNPFLGQADCTLAEMSALLGRISGASATMPADWYGARIADGTITQADLARALVDAPPGGPATLAALQAAATAPQAPTRPLPTIADLAADLSGIDWPGLIEDRIGAWAAGYFDTGQALWQATPGRGAFESWQIFASRDLTPEIAGLPGFAATVAATPRDARTALLLACDALGVTFEPAKTYFHQLLLGLGGWSQLARYRLWQAELGGGTDAIVTDLLAIRLIWEQALLQIYQADLAAAWAGVRDTHATPPKAGFAQIAGAILQEAADHSAQRRLGRILAAPVQASVGRRPTLQAAFCIDVRSEVFRRALESLDPGIATLGFAGFFGLATAHRGVASDVEEYRLPVLLVPGLSSCATGPGLSGADRSARLSARASRAWGRFKLAAVSSFAFVEATGPLYVGKLLRDAMGRTVGSTPDADAPQFDDSFAVQDRIAAAGAILRAMSLTDGFAPVVLIVGHGANVVNNPHASALHCGACGGHSGEVNARLLAGLLNEATVRQGLARDGIRVPDDTVFIGALHDTTTDRVTLYDGDLTIVADARALGQTRDWLAAAGHLARSERALRLPQAGSGSKVATRARDWSQTRPEWALAGCNAFIAAPRSRTRGKPLAGQAFLHDYDWTRDDGFQVLELILTAPVVVASWISLQYYGSVVAPDIFGSGSKVLHNVTGGIGVIEGNGGRLRAGLPWQSVHDGRRLAHAPLRLTVCLQAPQQAVTDILRRHPEVAMLFDNRWLHLFLLDQAGALSCRYTGNLEWSAPLENMAPDGTDTPVALAG